MSAPPRKEPRPWPPMCGSFSTNTGARYVFRSYKMIKEIESTSPGLAMAAMKEEPASPLQNGHAA